MGKSTNADPGAVVLYLTRIDGNCERVELQDRTSQEARDMVKRMFNRVPGLYVKAKILSAGKLVATLSNRLGVLKAKQAASI